MQHTVRTQNSKLTVRTAVSCCNIMKLVVDYEDEIYDFTLSESVDILSFVNILDQRPLLNCWLEDYVTKVWIRVPRIEVLRMLLKEFPVSYFQIALPS